MITETIIVEQIIAKIETMNEQELIGLYNQIFDTKLTIDDVNFDQSQKTDEGDDDADPE